MDDTAEMTWADHQEWERRWHGDCTNSFSEENKQITYAYRMGLVNEPNPYSGAWPSYDLGGRSVVDLGGGPVSLLLKCRNRGDRSVGRSVVVDPCAYPEWVRARYAEAGIHLVRMAAEDLAIEVPLDEAWIYNVLQHTRDPELIAANARTVAGVVRVFEWIDTPPEPGHPHTLTAEALDAWFGGRGTVEQINENGCVGKAWYGVFLA